MTGFGDGLIIRCRKWFAVWFVFIEDIVLDCFRWYGGGTLVACFGVVDRWLGFCACRRAETAAWIRQSANLAGLCINALLLLCLGLVARVFIKVDSGLG